MSIEATPSTSPGFRVEQQLNPKTQTTLVYEKRYDKL